VAAGIWQRLRRWFGAGRSVRTLELAFARYGEPAERRAKSRSGFPREMLHPLQGWQEEPHGGMSTGDVRFSVGRRPSLPRRDGRRYLP
jgi:hypothetical protein